MCKYAIQPLIINSWSWNGFANALLMGAVTGGVSGGLGQVFSASGFWGSVGSSAFVGAGTGGVTALLTGQNFLEGVLKGAVIGGGVAVVSWGIDKMVTAANITKGNHEYRISDSPINDSANSTDNLKYSYGTVHEFQEAYGGLGNYGVENVYLKAPEGYGIAQNGGFYEKSWWENLWGMDREITKGEVLGVTTPANDIYLSKRAFASKSLFVDSITHEVGHVVLNNSKYELLARVATVNMGKYSSYLDNWGHVSIRKMSVELFNKNSWLPSPWEMPAYLFNNSKEELDKLLLPLIKSFKF
ncbi:hypothetical protein [Chryseobacterium sp. S0630]|uniref:hypothetical protein n=1 Tax=Chryseobacterium sp. S0630 TaxID=2957803 RepID=UPI00209D933D|nr:hypothetical protein [Chryseobacterium sp. S0630]